MRRYILSALLSLVLCSRGFAVNQCIVGDSGAVDDSAVTSTTAALVTSHRAATYTYLWGTTGAPLYTQPTTVTSSVSDPVGVTGEARVDKLVINVRSGTSYGHTTNPILKAIAYHYIAGAPRNNRAVLLHHGHACTFDDGSGTPAYRMEATLQALLDTHFDVVISYMIGETDEDCGGVSGHNNVMTNASVTGPAQGNKLAYFVQGPLVILNYLDSVRPKYQDISMVGLSGGGWTTHIVASLDTRVKYAVPIAGSLPCYLRNNSASYGDAEQNYTPWMTVLGFLDHYTHGSFGLWRQYTPNSPRKQIMVLNQGDDCCFGPSQYTGTWSTAVRTFESTVKSAMTTLGVGTFCLHIDTTATTHQISTEALNNVILPVLAGTYTCQ